MGEGVEESGEYEGEIWGGDVAFYGGGVLLFEVLSPFEGVDLLFLVEDGRGEVLLEGVAEGEGGLVVEVLDVLG